MVLAQLAQNTMSLVDTIMVGKLGDEELAGMAIGSTTFFFTLMIFSGVLYAVSPLVANAVGANAGLCIVDRPAEEVAERANDPLALQW